MNNINKKTAVKMFNKGYTVLICGSKQNDQMIDLNARLSWWYADKKTGYSLDEFINEWRQFKSNKFTGFKPKFYCYNMDHDSFNNKSK